MLTKTIRRQVLIKWGLIFIVWTLLALLLGVPSFIRAVMEDRVASAWSSLFAELIFGYFWFALTPLALWLIRLFRIERGKWFRRVSIHCLISLGFSLVHSALFSLVSNPFGLYSQLTPWDRYLFLILTFTPVNVVFYWGIVVVHHAVDYYKDRELRASQLEAQLAQSQLQVLKMQLHPHFIFNTLNSISALIHESPDEADEMVARLGDLLRVTLETASVHEVPFREELQFLKHYIDIEQTRFQDRLKVTMEVDPETLDGLVPNLILQPLVENSVRHGIAPRPEGGCIKIKAWRDASLLRVNVEDDGPGFRADTPLKEGVGLTNTRARVTTLYGDGHGVTLRNAPGGGLVVNLTIPFKTMRGS